MKIRQLVRHWDEQARGRLTRDEYAIELSAEHEAKLRALTERYPMKSPEELLRDLLSAALDEMETSFPYVQGSKVVAVDEHGDEIYEDAGATPRFIEESQQQMKVLKKQLLRTVENQKG